MKMRILSTIIVMAISIFTSPAIAAYKESTDVKVTQVSVWSQSQDILVQTDPRPDISGLTCTSDHWLVLFKTDPGYQAALSMLLAAQTTKTNLIVRAEDNNGSQFCN